MAERVNRTTKVFGGFVSFLLGVLTTLATFRSPLLTLEIDSERITQRCLNVIVANGRYYGGGIHVAPDARMDSGRFEVFVLNDMGVFRAVANLPRFYGGAIKDRPDLVRCYTASRIVAQADERVLLNLDGEQPGQLPVTIDLVPAALDLVVG